jgi:hypothetical protein
VADKHDPAVIVVGSKGMHTGERERFGNIADKMSHKGVSSVLIVFTEDVSGHDDETMSGVAGSSGEAASP